MTINNIRLTPAMLADLYGRELIETGTTTVPDSGPSKYLGHNGKNIIVIVDHADSPFLPDHELNFLTTILAACKLSMADIAILNLHKTEIADIQNIIDKEGFKILLFGIEPTSIDLPINFPPFQLQAFNKRTYLHAPTLSHIEGDKGLKTKLWNALKSLFGI